MFGVGTRLVVTKTLAVSISILCLREKRLCIFDLFIQGPYAYEYLKLHRLDINISLEQA